MSFVGPCPHKDRDYHIGSNFWKLYIKLYQFHIKQTGFVDESIYIPFFLHLIGINRP